MPDSNLTKDNRTMGGHCVTNIIDFKGPFALGDKFHVDKNRFHSSLS